MGLDESTFSIKHTTKILTAHAKMLCDTEEGTKFIYDLHEAFNRNSTSFKK